MILVANLIETEEIDGIIIGSSDSIRLVPAVEKAINSGIPVIAMDTPLNSDRILTFVGFDNFAAGKSMGEWVV
ncbi:MAG: sugar ABC transporter substrate-binding protein, partial [Okeania sp. SIO2H7]|nr:sugar ABC transporter substrate-binding protein [Okeania sp. SIO2H7]